MVRVHLCVSVATVNYMNKKIIILIGPICAGKGQASDILQKKYHFSYFRFSASLEAIMFEKYGKITRELYATVANELREKYGPQALAKVTVEQAEKQKATHVVIDGARNPAEIEYIRSYYQHDNVIAIAINAPQELRFQRLLARKRIGDPQTFEAFKSADDKELTGAFGQNGIRINDCMQMADETIENNTDIQDLQDKIEQTLKKHLFIN